MFVNTHDFALLVNLTLLCELGTAEAAYRAKLKRPKIGILQPKIISAILRTKLNRYKNIGIHFV